MSSSEIWQNMTDDELDERINTVRRAILDDELARVAAGVHPDEIARENIEYFGDAHDQEF